MQDLAELYMLSTITHLSTSNQLLKVYKNDQSEDPICQQILTYCQTKWPDKKVLDSSLRPYWQLRGEITVGDGLLMRGQRIIVPESLQTETLRKIHEGHQGIVRCRLRARISGWWPGLSQRLTDIVRNCPDCARERRPSKEPLITSPLPEYPWQSIAADIFSLKGTEYLARHGVPKNLRTDNGPQFSSLEFADFATSYQFNHTTSSLPVTDKLRGQ